MAERDKKDQQRMVGRGELTDEAWRQSAPLLPGRGARGGQWRDHRTVIKRSSMGFSGSCVPEPRGVTCRSATAPGRPARTVSIGGDATGRGTAF